MHKAVEVVRGDRLRVKRVDESGAVSDCRCARCRVYGEVGLRRLERLPHARLARAGAAEREDAMANAEKLSQVDRLADKDVLRLELKPLLVPVLDVDLVLFEHIPDSFGHDRIGLLGRVLHLGEDVVDEAEEDTHVSVDELGHVRVAQCTHHDLKLGALRVGTLGATRDAQDALDRAQAPVVVVLFREQLHVELEEANELDREHLGRLEALGRELDLDDGRKVGRAHGNAAEERLEVLGQLGAPRVARVHRNEGTHRALEGNLLLLEDDLVCDGLDTVEQSAVLAGDHREHLDRDAVELVEAAPRARLRKPHEDVCHRLVVHLVGAVHHNDPDGEASTEILGRLGLACTRRARGRAAQTEAERLRERDVAAVGEAGDHEAAWVAHVLVRVLELGVRDVDHAVALLLVPAELELRLPRKVARGLDALRNVLEHDVARMHLDGDERLDLGAHLAGHLAEDHLHVHVQVGDLGHRVLLHPLVVTLLEPIEGLVHLGRPPCLARGDGELSAKLLAPRLARHLHVLVDRHLELVLELHVAMHHDFLEPVLDGPAAVELLCKVNLLLVRGEHALAHARL